MSKKEAIDTGTPTGRFMLTVFGAVAELEREYILQRQREGIAIAKEQENLLRGLTLIGVSSILWTRGRSDTNRKKEGLECSGSS